MFICKPNTLGRSRYRTQLCLAPVQSNSHGCYTGRIINIVFTLRGCVCVYVCDVMRSLYRCECEWVLSVYQFVLATFGCCSCLCWYCLTYTRSYLYCPSHTLSFYRICKYFTWFIILFFRYNYAKNIHLKYC